MKKSILIIPFLSILVLFSCSKDSEDIEQNLIEDNIELAEADDQLEVQTKMSDMQIVNRLVRLQAMRDLARLRDLAQQGPITPNQERRLNALNSNLRNRPFMRNLSQARQNRVLSQAYARLTTL
ncbi:hypothetical protein [Aquimarina aggregata]|uniref:hypothetical protein n=1 Tax=Aquimarina aggregata TaxID=1642818 RepID=UPI002490C125|nr:hypothetical protein [Aquimarina aggregata]